MNETPIAALCREIAEEMNVLICEHELQYYPRITAPAYGEDMGTIMEQDCFFLSRNVVPTASTEIGELKYFSLDEYLSESNQAPGAVIVLQRLKAGGYID